MPPGQPWRSKLLDLWLHPAVDKVAKMVGWVLAIAFACWVLAVSIDSVRSFSRNHSRALEKWHRGIRTLHGGSRPVTVWKDRDAWEACRAQEEVANFAELCFSGVLVYAPPGTPIRHLDSPWCVFRCGGKVQLLEGEHAGQIGWVPHNAVESPIEIIF